MSCKKCADTCGCAVVGQSGISVVGAGSGVNPFIITADFCELSDQSSKQERPGTATDFVFIEDQNGNCVKVRFPTDGSGGGGGGGGSSPEFPLSIVSVNSTLTEDHYYVQVTSSGTTMTLPAVSTAGNTKIIKNSSAGNIIISANGSETIDNSNTISVPPFHSVSVVDTGFEWIII